jgi:magnesium chelatase subunit I
MEEDRYFVKEFILWALVEYKKLSKYKLSTGMRFNDLYGSYISGLG